MNARRSGNPARLVVALSVAATLAIFLLYTSMAGSAASLTPRTLPGHDGLVTLTGQTVGPLRGDAHRGGLRFDLREIGGKASVPVVYRGSVPDLFAAGRHVFLQGRLQKGTFVAVPGSLVTKCPSKYVSKSGS